MHKALLLIAFLSAHCVLCQQIPDDLGPEPWHGKYADIFPGHIPGPKRLSDRIGIVGAGPSGIHMAYLLKEQGFTNVEIIEATFDLGGKSKTIDYRGAKHEMGTCYLSADYEKNVLRLVKKFTNGTTKAPPLASVWSNISSTPELFSRFYMKKLMVRYRGKSVEEIQQLLKTGAVLYIRLHKQMFGEYYGELMPEPSTEVKKLINGTFLEFLERNGLDDLEDLFIASFTVQGYGNLKSVPALYGLMWNTPQLVESLMGLASGKTGAIYMLQDGFQNLWKNMVIKNQLNIKYGLKVKYISWKDEKLSSSVSVDLKKVKDDSAELVRRHYDFLVWTPPANSFIRVASRQRTKEERKLFSRMTNSYYSTTLVDDVGAKRAESAVNWWYDNIQFGHDMSVWANRDSYTMFHDLSGSNYTHRMTLTGNDDARQTRTSVFYQYSRTRPSKKGLAKELRHHLQNLGAESMKIKEQFRWKYFTRFRGEDAQQGYHWRVLEIQGRNNVWFAGSSVCFESVKSVVEYNQLLVDRMKKPDY